MSLPLLGIDQRTHLFPRALEHGDQRPRPGTPAGHDIRTGRRAVARGRARGAHHGSASSIAYFWKSIFGATITTSRPQEASAIRTSLRVKPRDGGLASPAISLRNPALWCSARAVGFAPRGHPWFAF